MASDTELLDRIFNAPDEQVETFADVIRKESSVGSGTEEEQDFLGKAAKGETTGVSKDFSSKTQIQGFVSVTSGWNDKDFIWHIGPAHNKKPWKVTIDRVIYAIVHTLNEILPKEQIVDIFPPYDDWEIQEITLKAIGLKDSWAVSESDLEDLNVKFLNVLNPLIK